MSDEPYLDDQGRDLRQGIDDLINRRATPEADAVRRWFGQDPAGHDPRQCRRHHPEVTS